MDRYGIRETKHKGKDLLKSWLQMKSFLSMDLRLSMKTIESSSIVYPEIDISLCPDSGKNGILSVISWTLLF